MPTPPVIDDSKTFDPTNSLYKETPQPKPPEIPKEVVKIPKFDKEKPKPPSPKSRDYGQQDASSGQRVQSNTVASPSCNPATRKRRLPPTPAYKSRPPTVAISPAATPPTSLP